MQPSFVAIDFETAINHHICSVGIVTVVNGEITEEYHALIQPPNNFYSQFTIQVHGIMPMDTRNEPYFPTIYPEIKKRLQNKIVVAHNEGFDRSVLAKTMADYSLNYSELNIGEKWDCTVKMYRKRGYKSAKLDACCKVHNIELQHHDALSDARACAKLYMIGKSEMLF